MGLGLKCGYNVGLSVRDSPGVDGTSPASSANLWLCCGFRI